MYFLAATLLIATAVDGARGEGYAYTPRGTPYAWLDGYDLRTDLNDDDDDGRLTWEEYVAGTHPKIADAFTIESISVQGGRVILRWPSSSTGERQRRAGRPGGGDGALRGRGNRRPAAGAARVRPGGRVLRLRRGRLRQRDARGG